MTDVPMSSKERMIILGFVFIIFVTILIVALIGFFVGMDIGLHYVRVP